MAPHVNKFIFFITGASGVGKSTLTSHLKLYFSNRPDITIFGFDTIGIPSIEEMKLAYGSPQEWQRAATKQWVTRILYEVSEPVVVLEGQVNIDFIYEAFEDYKFSEFHVILIDCSEQEMIRRLIYERGQQGLANENMKSWRAYLRKQAEERQVDVIDTEGMPIDESVNELQSVIANRLNLRKSF